MISLVVPCYNEQERIAATIAEIESYINDPRSKYVIDEVILVDDGSKDATVERAMRYMKRIPLVVERLPENKGKWAAIRHGLQIAKNDGCVIIDADGSASVYECNSISSDVFNLKVAVFGSRFMPQSTVMNKTGFRRFISWGYRVYVKWWFWFAGGKDAPSDFQCPFKLVWKSKLRSLPEVDRFSGDIDLALRVKGQIYNMPVHFVHKAGSKVKSSTVKEMALETAKVAWNHRFRK